MTVLLNKKLKKEEGKHVQSVGRRKGFSMFKQVVHTEVMSLQTINSVRKLVYTGNCTKLFLSN
jgi:hypothetical protein